MRLSRQTDYESMTNPELLAIAKKKGMRVLPAQHNQLTIVRAVVHDKQGESDRQAFVDRLRTFDAQRNTHTSNAVAALSLLVALASLYISLLKK